MMSFGLKDVTKGQKKTTPSVSKIISLTISELKRDPSYYVVFIASAANKVATICLISFGNVLLERFKTKHEAE